MFFYRSALDVQDLLTLCCAVDLVACFEVLLLLKEDVFVLPGWRC